MFASALFFKRPVTKELVISIITPSYNQERFIEETLQSVLSQEGNFVIDYIVIDGESSDGSVDIIKKYEGLLERGEWPVRCKGIRYRWVSEPDRGQTDAINKGFRLAVGDIIAWINSDDTYLPGALNKVVEYFGSNPKAMFLYGNTYYVDENGKNVAEYPTQPFDYEKLAVYNLFSQQATFIKKEAYAEVGEMDLNLTYTMDYDLWVRIAERHDLSYLPEFLATYRIHEESKTFSPTQAHLFMRETLMTVFRHYRWAPANRVYGYSYTLVAEKVPILVKIKPVSILCSLLVSAVIYFKYNRGLRLKDLKMINGSNIRKLFRDWSDILRGAG